MSKSIPNDVIAIILGIGGALGLGLLLFKAGQHTGLTFGYAGLTREEVVQVANEMDSKHDILSRVHGGDTNHEFYRGIYLDYGQGVPLYYRYDLYANGEASYELYPMLWAELWSTTPDYLGLSGDLVYP